MDQQFSLSWNNFHGNLSRGFAGLLGNGEFVDVTIAVDGHLLQAHKVILSICSPYFKKMFQLNPCQHPIVLLRDVSHKAMRDLLQFMYNGEVSVKREDLTSFIQTAEVLQIKGLTNKETEDKYENCEEELPKQNDRSHNNNNPQHTVTNVTEQVDTNLSEDMTKSSETELIKQKEFLERIHRLSNLKRKSEEFIQNSFYNSDFSNLEKRLKIKDKNTVNIQNMNQALQANNYEQLRNMFEERTVDLASAYTNHITPIVHNSTIVNKEYDDPTKFDKTQQNDSVCEFKTECEDSDNVMAVASISTSPKSYEDSKDGQKAPDYLTVQDNCSSLSSLFMDLKNLVNGKGPHISLLNNPEDHCLTTIPQKEDGKKKYPQRSCKLCWKLGKRRDTRFMCNACQLPFCKNPCFEVHFNDVIKTAHLQTDYFAN